MNLTAKKKNKLQKKLRTFPPRGKCWICESTHGIKTSREGYGIRCKKCIEENKTNNEIEEYNKILELLKDN